MVDMEKREKLVVGLTTRHIMIRSGSSSSPRIGSNRNEGEGGAYNTACGQKKGKGKALKWKLSNSDMNGKVEPEGSDGDYGDTVLSSLTTASFSSLITRNRVRTLGKVAEDCDFVDPTPVPRKLRSAINKRIGRTISSSSRHVRKRRHLSVINTQTSFMDHETRLNQSLLWNSFSKEEEVVAEALLSLSQAPPLCEPTGDKAMAEDSSNINVASTSYSEGTIKEEDKIIVLPSAANEAANQPAHTGQPVEQSGNIPQINPMPGATYQLHNSINSPLSKDGQIQDVSLGIVTSSPSPSKDSSNNSARNQLKVQFDDSPSYPTQKPDVPRWLVNSNKSDLVVHEGKKAKNNSAQERENAPLLQTPLPCTSHGSSSSTLEARTNTATETAKASSTGNHEKIPLVKNGCPAQTWKRCITHVYVSHLIQMHLNKEKASQNQVKPEERSHIRVSRSPNGSTLPKNNIQDERFYAVHFDVRPPVQPSGAICDTTTGRQKIVSGNFLNLPASTALQGAQHLQYLHPPIAPRGAMPFPFPHLPYARGNLAPAAALQQQIPQYMRNPGYAPPRPSLTASSAMMKLQQLVPTQHHHHHQQMWQFHVPGYQPRPDAAPAAWQNSRVQDMSSRRPMPTLPSPAMPPQIELFCAPYQGGSRQPPQLRLI